MTHWCILSALFACFFTSVVGADLSARPRSFPLLRRAHPDATSETEGLERRSIPRRHHSFESIAAEHRRLRAIYGRSLSSGEGSEDSTHLAKRNSNPSVELHSAAGDYAYYIPVSIGTPPQTFELQMGTAAADFILPSVHCCGNSSTTNNITHFDSAKSKTYKQISKSTINYHFFTGNGTGVQAQDTVSIANYTIKSVQFVLVDSIPEESTVWLKPISGYMGFGWPYLSEFTSVPTPWWKDVITSGQWAQPQFSVYLARELEAPDGGLSENGGSLALGFADSKYYTGDITWSPLPNLSQLMWWEVLIQALQVGTSHVDCGNTIAILDTATPFMTGPTNVVEALYGFIPGAVKGENQWDLVYNIPCDTNVSFSFTIANVTYPINLVDFVVHQNATACVGALQGLDNIGNNVSWTLGNAFLKNVYASYRASPPAVGFAQLAPEYANAGTGNSNPPPSSTGSIVIPTSYQPTPTSSKSSASALSTMRPIFLLGFGFSVLLLQQLIETVSFQ